MFKGICWVLHCLRNWRIIHRILQYRNVSVRRHLAKLKLAPGAEVLPSAWGDSIQDQRMYYQWEAGAYTCTSAGRNKSHETATDSQ